MPSLPITRQMLTKLHLLLAAFIFPVILMYIVTGALYTWGIEGSDLPDQVHDVDLVVPLTTDIDAAKILIKQELQDLSIAPPTGDADFERMDDGMFEVEWEGSQRVVLLESTADPLVARLTIQEAGWYRSFVQLHKAKGGMPFKVYAVGLATGLVLLLASGFVMAWQVPRYRRSAVTASALGVGLFIAMFLLS
jgi:hypothetical protein